MPEFRIPSKFAPPRVIHTAEVEMLRQQIAETSANIRIRRAEGLDYSDWLDRQRRLRAQLTAALNGEGR